MATRDLPELDTIRQFSYALKTALRDRKLEENLPVFFLFDADVAIKTVYGLTIFSEEVLPDPETDHRLAVRALLSTRRFARIRMLWAHLIEFNRNLNSWPHLTVMREAFHLEQIRQLEDAWGLAEHNGTLGEIVKKNDSDLFSQFLRKYGWETFVKLELCYGGTWQQRLHRLVKGGVFDFTPIDPADRFITSGDFVLEVYEELSGHRDRQDSTYNNIVDASALDVLRRLISHRAKFHVRFYTETRALSDLGKGFTALCYSPLDPETSVFIDESYCLMRSSFSALLPGHSTPELEYTSDVGPSREELSRISAELQLLLSKDLPETEFRKAVARISVDYGPGDASATLVEVIHDFYRLRFLNNVVLQWKLPLQIRDMVPNLRAAYETKSLMESARIDLNEAFYKVSETLKKQIGHLSDWRNDFLRIRAALLRRRSAIGHLDSPPRLDTDIGLARWGLDKSLTAPEEIRDFIHSILEERESQINIRASEFALELLDRSKSKQKVELVITVLWFLQLTRLIVREFKLHEEEIRDLPSYVGLKALDYVAQVKSVYDDSMRVGLLQSHYIETCDKVLSDIENFTNDLDETSAPIGLMGLAHAAYWAWCRLEKQLGARLSHDDSDSSQADMQDLKEVADRWAKKSFSAGKDAASKLKAPQIDWAFAVNHCAYLGHSAGIFKEETGEFYTTLSPYLDDYNHYRFADTMALPFSQDAERILRVHGLLGSPPKERNSASLPRACCEKLEYAKHLLEKSRPWFGDQEVEHHYRQILYLLNLARCVD